MGSKLEGALIWVMFQTAMLWQTVQTQIRLLVVGHCDHDLHCFFLPASFLVPLSINLRFAAVWKFRNIIVLRRQGDMSQVLFVWKLS